MVDVLNASSYTFQAIADPTELSNQIGLLGGEFSIKGTILVSEEGINCNISGAENAVHGFQRGLGSFLPQPFQSLRESISDYTPFNGFRQRLSLGQRSGQALQFP